MVVFDSRFALPARYAIAVPVSPIISSHRSLYDDRCAALHGLRRFVGTRVFAARWRSLEKPKKNEGPRMPVLQVWFKPNDSRGFEPAPADGPSTEMIAGKGSRTMRPRGHSRMPQVRQIRYGRSMDYLPLTTRTGRRPLGLDHGARVRNSRTLADVAGVSDTCKPSFESVFRCFRAFTRNG